MEEIIYPFPNLRPHGSAIEIWEWMSNFIPNYWATGFHITKVKLLWNHLVFIIMIPILERHFIEWLSKLHRFHIFHLRDYYLVEICDVICAEFNLRDQHQTITWTYSDLLYLRNKNFNQNECWFKKMHLKMSSAKWQPFCWHLNMLWSFGTILCSGSIHWFSFVSTFRADSRLVPS